MSLPVGNSFRRVLYTVKLEINSTTVPTKNFLLKLENKQQTLLACSSAKYGLYYKKVTNSKKTCKLLAVTGRGRLYKNLVKVNYS